MAIVDNKTPRLGLLLPNADNFLQDDVVRLIDTFNLLDVLVVMRDQTTGKIADSELSAVIAKLDAQGKLNKSVLPTTVVQTGADGKIDASVLPSIAVIDSFPVPSEATMLGLQCERGDIAIRTDLGKTFILTQMPPSTLSNWRELTTTSVSSVNGKTGAITGIALSGANNDITSLNALSGPLRLGGEAAGDYDAVTLKQLRAASGGAGGASMNGVMNNFIGAVDWFLGSRAKLPAGYLEGDGQLVLRSQVPDIVAAMKSGFLKVMDKGAYASSDAAWKADPRMHGFYSWGDGDETTGTTIRMPDLNGKYVDYTNSALNSIAGPFLRGDGRSGINNNESGSVGEIRRSAAPNIKASFGVAIPNISHIGIIDPSGAVSTIEASTAVMGNAAGITSTTGARGIIFDASQKGAFKVYDDNASEIRPNSVTGIWIIRVNGSFTAQNTNFNVIAGDTTAPATGTLIKGGEIVSQYQIGGSTHIKSVFQVKGKYLQDGWSEIALVDTVAGTQVGTAELHPGSTMALRYDTAQAGGVTFGGVFRSISTGKTVLDIYGQTEANGYSSMFMTLRKDGNAAFASRVMQFNEANDLVIFQNPTVTNATRGGAFSSRAGDRYMNILSYDTPGVDGGAVIETGNGGSGLGFYFFATASDANKTGKILSSTRGLVMFEGSDASWKKNKVPVKPGCLERIEQFEVCEYDWIDSGYHERGWIAQQLRDIDPQYVTGDDKLSVSTKAVIADLIGSVQTLSARVKELEARK